MHRHFVFDFAIVDYPDSAADCVLIAVVCVAPLSFSRSLREGGVDLLGVKLFRVHTLQLHRGSAEVVLRAHTAASSLPRRHLTRRIVSPATMRSIGFLRKTVSLHYPSSVIMPTQTRPSTI